MSGARGGVFLYFGLVRPRVGRGTILAWFAEEPRGRSSAIALQQLISKIEVFYEFMQRTLHSKGPVCATSVVTCEIRSQSMLSSNNILASPPLSPLSLFILLFALFPYLPAKKPPGLSKGYQACSSSRHCSGTILHST